MEKVAGHNSRINRAFDFKNFVCTLFSPCRINGVEENDQNLWDVINDTFVVILANENMCVAL